MYLGEDRMTSIKTIELEHRRMKEYQNYKEESEKRITEHRTQNMLRYEKELHFNVMKELEFMAEHEIKSFVRRTKLSQEG